MFFFLRHCRKYRQIVCLEKISADTNKGEVQHRSLPFLSSSIFAVFQSSSRKRFSVRRVWCRNKERISYKFRDKRKVGLLLNWKEELRSKILLPSIRPIHRKYFVSQNQMHQIKWSTSIVSGKHQHPDVCRGMVICHIFRGEDVRFFQFLKTLHYWH